MKKLVLASASAIALLGLAACSDTDQSTTQSTPAPVEDPAAPMTPSTPDVAPDAPATDGGTTQSIEPAPDAGMQPNETAPAPIEPAPSE